MGESAGDGGAADLPRYVGDGMGEMELEDEGDDVHS